MRDAGKSSVLSVFIIALSFIFLSCGSGNSETAGGTGPVIDLPSELVSVFDRLTGTVTIYDKNNQPLEDSSISFLKDAGGVEKFSIPLLTLPKGTIVRFVFRFAVDKIDVCYWHSTQTISSAEQTSITFNINDFICEVPNNMEPSQMDLLTADVTAGLLPDLDLDDDGFSNLVELKSGSDPNDVNSIPTGPKIEDFAYAVSADGSLMTFTANITDPVGVTQASLNFMGAEYLSAALQTEFLGNDGDTQRAYKATLDLRNAPAIQSDVSLIATNSTSLSSTQTLAITFDKAGNASANLGPLIIFETLEEGQTLDSLQQVNLHAYDRDGVASLKIDQPSNLINTTDAKDRFQALWDTTSAADGIFTVKATATDNLGAQTTTTLRVSLAHGVDSSGPQVQLRIFSSPRMTDGSEINYQQEGQNVKGQITFQAIAQDPNKVDILLFSDNPVLSNALGPVLVSSQTTYVRTLDTTRFADGTIIELLFTARDGLGNESHTHFSMRIQNDHDGDGFNDTEDCDPNSSHIYPNAPETCDGKDDDCDGLIDEDANLCPCPVKGTGAGFLETALPHPYMTCTSSMMSWNDARNFCQSYGYHLWTISSAIEASEVINLLFAPRNMWIGLSNITQAGSGSWVTGEALVYRNWNPAHPTLWGPSICAYIPGFFLPFSTQWESHTCSESHGFICEAN